MKLIIAYLQPEKLPAVKAELQKAEIGRLSATNALGLRFSAWLRRDLSRSKRRNQLAQKDSS